MKRQPLLSFFIMTFAITWGVGALMMILPSQLASVFGEMDMDKPFYKAVFHLAVYGPAISAFAVIALVHGAAGVRAYLRRFLHFRAGVGWYLLVLVGIPAMQIFARGVFGLVGGTAPAYPHEPWFMVIPMALLKLVDDPGPIEEFGWRGFALPLLQQRYSALGASLILGVIWGVWHLPAFYISATPQAAFSFPLFLLGSVSYAVIMTAVYNGTNGSIPLAFLFHWQINNAFGFGIYPQGEWISPVSFALLALVFVVVLGPRNLGRGKCTELVSLKT